VPQRRMKNFFDFSSQTAFILSLFLLPILHRSSIPL
jgi:hypothetical protein